MEYKKWVIETLESWVETFDLGNYDCDCEYGEDCDCDAEEHTYEQLTELLERYANNECDKEDYETIIFQLWQKFNEEYEDYDESDCLIKLRLDGDEYTTLKQYETILSNWYEIFS